ncbi:hypothetical protein [Sodalis sp. dw_96]|uniref:hypothetical protein n=1 Tax=Sodalis sp. dw_96 TaxID=2719794 RepID=UPI001BD563BB|nr:hypothetical protein [Sodalis sp. dw_96]
MGQAQSFNAIKDLLTELNAGQTPRGEDIPLNIDNNVDFDAVYKERLGRFFSGYDDLYRAAQNKDPAAIKTALARAKIVTLSLTCFFTALEDDCISLLSRQGGGCPEPDTLSQTHSDGNGVAV